jgi:hypothetical protein
MDLHLTVVWGKPSQSHSMDVLDAKSLASDEARTWLDEQFVFFACEPIRATGKVLTADKVLCVAQAAGPERFTDAAHRPWAKAFVLAACGALAKPMITIDLDAMTLTY